MPLPENVPTATLDLDRPRRIALTLGAMRRMRQRGIAIDDVLKKDGDPFEAIGPLVWCALIDEDRDVEEEALEDMIPLTMVPQIQSTLFDLIAGQQSEIEEQAKNAPGKAPARKRASRKK